ncbi:hypothetical protein ACEPPO_00915 (plasmid) [Limosilactobacillus fermentum]
MSKELYFTDGNNEVKYLDTTASFNLAITQDGSAFDLTNATAIDVKVANDTGYVFDKSIDMTTIKQPLAGLITMPVDAEVMNTLVPDDYTIEVWVTLSSLITPGSQEGLTDTSNDGSTTNTSTSTTDTTTYNAIFPSDDPQGFTITENVMSDSGDVIPVMSMDEFKQEFDQLKTDLTYQVSTLQGPAGKDGKDGATGPQGPQGIQGPKGDTGQGLDIKGKVDTTSQLPSTAIEGDGYLVAEELYIWMNNAWKDCGQIQGPKGDTGPQGPAGKDGTQVDLSNVVHLDDLLGGSNLLLNSKFDKNLDNWSSWGDSTGGTLGFVAGTDNWDNRATTLLHITKPTASGYFGVAQTGVSVAPNSQYVLSAYRTGSGKLFLQNGNGTTDSYQHTEAESVSGIATHKFTTGNTRTTNIYIGMGDGDTGELYISLTKLEKGVTHSDWSPAPEDITIDEDSIGLVNLIYNSQYSNSGDGWKLYPGAYYSDSDISSYNGSLGLGFSKAGNSVSAPVAMSKPMPLVGDGTVIPTDVYSARVKAKIYSDSSSDTKFILTIAFLDSTSKRIGYRETFVTPDTSEDWQDVRVLGAGVPTGTSNIQIQFYTQGTLAHGMFVNPMLVKGPVVGPYRPDTIGMADVTGFATKTDVTTAISAATDNMPSKTDVNPLIQGVVHDGTDLNNELQPGTFFSPSKVVNGPGFYNQGYGDQMITWTVIRVISGTTSVYTQNAYNRNGECATRNFVSGSGWGSWKILSTDPSKPMDFPGGITSGGVDVATAADLKSIEDSAWRQLDNKYISTKPTSNTTISSNTVILYKLDTDNKRIYLQGTIFISSNVTSNLSTAVSVDFSGIAKTISFASGYYALQYWGNDPSSLYGSTLLNNKLTMYSTSYGYLSISNLSSSSGSQSSTLAYVTYDELV